MLFPRAIIACILVSHLSYAQLFSFPQCIEDCVNSSEDSNCSVTDLKCICRASSGTFLPSIIQCMHSNCNNNLDVLLDPLKFTCRLIGTPIPDSAIQDAENQASSLATQVTMTVDKTSVSTKTVTTTQSGSTLTLVFPVTIEKTTTVSGPGPTITSSVSVTGGIGVVSTYTTTNDDGETKTQTSTFTTSSTSSSPSSTAEASDAESTTVVETSVAAVATTQTDAGSSTSTSDQVQNSAETNSAPFTDTNAGSREQVSKWLGLGASLVLCYIWV